MGDTTQTSSLAKYEPASQRAIVTRDALNADTEQRALLAEYIAHHMREGSDYGKIPGVDKPTLLKPGAEKLVDLFRCTPKFALVKCEENFDKGFFNYIFRVRLCQRDAKEVLAEGFGSANSREGRYRWRNAQLKCPECKAEAVLKSKNAAEGFFCWRKKGGCGATFGPNDIRVTEQPLGKIENEDVATLANTILKMAKKRALVDGAIALARCSDMLTQDVEDLIDHAPETPATQPPAAAEPAAAPPPVRTQPTASPKVSRMQLKSEPAAEAVQTPPVDKAKAARARKIWERAKATGMSNKDFGAWVKLALGSEVASNLWTEPQMVQLEAEVTQHEAAERQLATQATPAAAPAPAPAAAPPRDSPMVRFGRDKGKTLAQVDDLGWLRQKASEDVAKNDAKWHRKNVEWLKAIDDELLVRARSEATSDEDVPF